jgi:hypothetical protein
MKRECMKILLLGEFSALHKNLKEGLLELGHDVDIASSGDGWKDIDRDIYLNANGSYLTRGIKRVIKKYKLLDLVKNYDVVQLINPFELYGKAIPNKLFFKQLIKNSKKFYLLGAGSDSYFWLYGRGKLKYGPFDDILRYDSNNAKKSYLECDRAFKVNKFIADNCDGIIPIMFEYETSYEGHENLLNTIPIPINTHKIKYRENKVVDKIIIFHGLNRYGFKGTKYIEEAFEILSQKHPDDLELIIDGKMPLDKYLEVMKKTNVVVDQTSSYSLGVNGIYALAMGKIVLGGAEPESLRSLGVEASPVINIEPNSLSIIEEIEKLLTDKEKIMQLGYESRQFSEEIHQHIKIAKKYVETWNMNCGS